MEDRMVEITEEEQNKGKNNFKNELGSTEASWDS